MAFLKLSCVLLACLFGAVQLCQLSQDPRVALEEYIKNKTTTVNTRYKLQYHVTPPVGWMNDPNGFIYYNKKYHLFYQYNPYDTQSVTGKLHWGHVSSSDLFTWEQMSTALMPYNGVQCFSGSAVDMNGILVLMYTGDTGNDSSTYKETQYLAYSDDGKTFTNYLANPVLYPDPKTQDFRDPKAWKYENNWYAVIGSKTVVGTATLGTVLLYKSTDLVNWEKKSTIGTPSATLGSMWECPDFFPLGDKYVLMMSPQGMTASGDRFKNQFQTGTIIGTFDYTTLKFVEETNFEELDYGHDFYATQTTEVNGQRILIAWMGMWDAAFTEKSDGWAGAMTIPRVLTLSSDNTRVLMNPPDQITQLRDTTSEINTDLVKGGTITALEKTGELIITLDATKDFQIDFTGSTGGGSVSLSRLVSDTKVKLVRNGDTTNARQKEWVATGTVKTIRVFLDASSIEVFCGDGDVVFSSRVYPLGSWVVTNNSDQTLSIKGYKLKKTVS